MEGGWVKGGGGGEEEEGEGEEAGRGEGGGEEMAHASRLLSNINPLKPSAYNDTL